MDRRVIAASLAGAKIGEAAEAAATREKLRIFAKTGICVEVIDHKPIASDVTLLPSLVA